MTAPSAPSKAKTYIALAGALLTALVPFILQISVNLPQPWPGVIAGAIALATAFGVYHAPYSTGSNAPPASGKSPWPAS